MPLPSIAPYDLPATESWPPRRAGWRLDPERAVFLIHDMQRYFVDAFAPGTGLLDTVIANLETIRGVSDRLGVPVILSVQPPRQHPARRGLLGDLWGPGLTDDADAALIDPLAPRASDIQLTKWRYSAFERTDLQELLGALRRDQLIIGGVYAHIGCQLTAAAAFMRDVQAFFVADAVADFSLADHVSAVDYVNRVCGTAVTTNQVIDDLSAPRFRYQS